MRFFAFARGVCLVTFLALFAGMTVGVINAPTAQAVGVINAPTAQVDSILPDEHTPGYGWTAPAPMRGQDLSGAAHDTVCFPERFNHPQYGFGFYRVNGQTEPEGCYSTNGATSVKFTTDYDSGTWTFYFDTAVTTVEATNAYSVVVGNDCLARGSDRYRKVTAYFTNTRDVGEGGLPIYSIYPSAEDVADQLSVFGTNPVFDVADGTTVAIPMRTTDEAPGLRPATYVVSFYRSDTGNAGNFDEGHVRLVKRLRIPVPSCDRPTVPPGTGPGGTNPGKPQARLRQVGKHRMLVVANAKPVKASVQYMVIKDPRRGKTTVKKFTASSNKILRKKFRGLPGTRFIVKAKTPKGWVVLASKRIVPIRR